MSNKKINRELITTALSLLFRHRMVTFLFLGAAIVGILSIHFLRPTYKATSVVHLRSPETSPILSATAKITGYSPRDFGQMALNQGYLKILNSQGLAPFIAKALTENFDAFGPLPTDLLAAHGIELKSGDLPSPEAIIAFADSLVGSTYFRGREDDLIDISSITSSPTAAVQSTNLMNSIIIRYLFEYESKEVGDIEVFLDRQIADTQARINDLSEKVEVARSKVVQSDLYVVTPQQSLSRLQEEFELARIRLEENQTILDKFSKEIRNRSGREPSADDGEPIGLRGRLTDKYNTLIEERQSLQSKFTAIKTRLQTLSKEYRPEYEQKALELVKKLETEHYLYQELKRQLSDMNVYRISIANRVRPYSLANPIAAVRETSLDKKLIMGSLGALAVVLIILYLLEQANPILLSKEDLTSMGVVPIGSIPQIGVKPSLWFRLQSWLAGLPVISQTRTKERLALQFLRSRMVNILKRRTGKGQVVSIMSADPNDGKSFVCANLAQLMGHVKMKTLVVDFDVFKNATSDFFKSEGREGLLDVLEHRQKVDEVIVQTEIANVHFLPSGTSTHKAETMASPDIKELLNSLREKYDLILLDTPAYMARPESIMIANESDHLIIVANFGTTKLLAIRELLESLNPERLTHLYGVMNRHQDFFRSAYHPYYVHAYSVVKGEDSSVAS